MFNVRIFRIKDLIKYAVIIIIAVLLIILLLNLTARKIESEAINQTLPNIAKEKKEEKKEENDNNVIAKILKNEVSILGNLDKNEQKKENEEIEDEIITENNQNIDNIDEAVNISINDIPNVVQTENVTEDPIAESFNVQYGNVRIKNQTEYELTEEMMDTNIEIPNKDIVIYHTHTCESYTPSEKYPYIQTGTFRTTDINYSVVRVGNELENYLKQFQYNVIHDITYHDYPAYNGSYTRSLETVNNIVSQNPADIIIDLHRDAVGSRSDYAPTIKIGNEYAAQLMFVIGTNNGGLWHPNWNQNLKFAIKVQEKAEEMYPGLFKPIMLTQSRYNQHVGRYASIIEVGSTGNTLEQTLVSMKYLAKIINEVVN